MSGPAFETLTERLQRRSAAVSARRVRRTLVWLVTLTLAAMAFVWAFLIGLELMAQLPRLLAVLP